MLSQRADRALQAVKILLVEDSDDIREAFTGLLRTEGADVVAVARGTDAITAALEGNFDVVLTDYGLPDIPGDFVIRQVLAAVHRRPHVVVITGYGEPYTSWARLAGADLVLTKPVDWPDLLAHIRPDRYRAAA